MAHISPHISAACRTKCPGMLVAHEIGTDKPLPPFRDHKDALRKLSEMRRQGKFQERNPRVVIREYRHGKWVGEGYRLQYKNGWHKEYSATGTAGNSAPRQP